VYRDITADIDNSRTYWKGKERGEFLELEDSLLGAAVEGELDPDLVPCA